MSPHRVLIVYGTSHGQTAKIATRIAKVLSGLGYDPVLLKGDAVPPGISLDAFDGVIVGASIIFQRHQRYIARFVRHYASALNTTVSAFFSVSGSAGTAEPKSRAAAHTLVERFLDNVGWEPTYVALFGGAVAYTQYNILLRWVMKQISAREGGFTDTSRDYELTDWREVERFTREFALALPLVSPTQDPQSKHVAACSLTSSGY